MAGTPVLTPDGFKAIEEFVAGDLLFSRDEADPESPIRVQKVEETFCTTAPIVSLVIGGQKIETTAKHPFYVQGKGRIPVEDLQPGDMIAGKENQLTAIESIAATGRTETVYNIRVSEDHTYFVGDETWGFSVWVHNAYKPKKLNDGSGKWGIGDDSKPGWVTEADGRVKTFDNGATASRKSDIWNREANPKSWTANRKRAWKSITKREPANPSGKYSSDNIDRMLNGDAPQMRVKMVNRKTGKEITKDISIELHHTSLPQRLGSTTHSNG